MIGITVLTNKRFALFKAVQYYILKEYSRIINHKGSSVPLIPDWSSSRKVTKIVLRNIIIISIFVKGEISNFSNFHKT